jgi:cellulose synthase operon protein C
MSIPVEIILQVRSQYDRGAYLQAYQAAIDYAPLSTWQEPQARLLAGRIAMQMGAHRLGTAYHLRAWRSDRQSASAGYFYARAILSRQGALKAWKFVRSIANWEGATPKEIAEWYSVHTHILTQFRDFTSAGDWLTKAVDLDPENYWLYICKGLWLEEQDLYAEAIASARFALQLKPNDGAAITTISRMSILLGKEDEALEILTTAAQTSESNTLLHYLLEFRLISKNTQSQNQVSEEE